MKPLLIILAMSLTADARAIAIWPEAQLLEKSDLVVDATPVSTAETLERVNLPGMEAVNAIGVETAFDVSKVIKGDPKTIDFILHHYRAGEGIVVNGPCLIEFKPEEKRSYRMYLVKEEDGRYAPTVGQVDPAINGIKEIAAPAKEVLTPEAAGSLRFTMDITDGSRIVGTPAEEMFSLKTSLGVLELPWRRVKSIAPSAEAGRLSLTFRNGDQADGTIENKTLALHSALGDLKVPLDLMKRVRVEEITGGRGPVAWWSFNNPEKLGADDSGHGLDLKVERAKSTDGRIGKAVATGENRANQGLAEFLITDSQPDLQFKGDFTLAVWAWRSAPFYDGDQIIAKDGEFSLRRYQFPTERYNVELIGKQGLPLAKVSETQSGLPLETWTLIVVSRQDDRLRIRVNDLPAVETQVIPGEVGGDSPFYVGCSPTGYPWQGKLDEIKKWNRALTDEEQADLFREKPEPKKTGNP